MSFTNPYRYNLPVEPDMFFGRWKNVDDLISDLCATPGDSCALIGGRRIGKTSLLEALVRSLESHSAALVPATLAIPIFLDFTGEGIDSPLSFFRIVSDQMGSLLSSLLPLVPGSFDLLDGLAPAPAFKSILVTCERELLAQRGQRLRLVLLLDECEQIVERPWSPELYGALRYLLDGRTTRSAIKVIMAGSHQFLTQVRQHGSPLRNILKYHMLRAIDVESSYELIDRPTSGVLPREVVAEIIEQVGGHPFLTQYVMHNLWQRGLDIATVESVGQIANMFSHERHDFQDWTVLENRGELSIARWRV
jgi:hypothetical protein